MMKAIFLLVALTITIGYIKVANATESDDIDMEKRCIQETGASKVDLEVYSNGKVPRSKAGKCFLACCYKSTGAFKNGKYIAEGALETFAEQFDKQSPDWETIKAITKTCEKALAELTTTDECVLAGKALECEVQNMKKDGLI